MIPQRTKQFREKRSFFLSMSLYYFLKLPVKFHEMNFENSNKKQPHTKSRLENRDLSFAEILYLTIGCDLFDDVYTYVHSSQAVPFTRYVDKACIIPDSYVLTSDMP